MWCRNTKWENAVENGADSLAQCRDGTKVQFVKKNAIFVKHKVKLNKPQRYACLLSRKKKKTQENKRLHMVWFLLCDMSRKANLWRQ